MANLVIPIPDAVVARIQAAYAVNGVPATASQVVARIKAQLQADVASYETSLTAMQKSTAVQAEVW